MYKTRIAVIGAGNHARRQHYPALKFIKEIDLCAACDLSVEKLNQVKEEFDIPAVYTDYRKLIAEESPDGIVVVLTPKDLTRVVLDCLKLNQNLMIEKPPGCDLDEAREILEFSQRAKRKIMVSMNRRFMPVINMVRKLTREKPVCCSATYNKSGFFSNAWAHPYELLVADSIHLIDLMTYVCGEAKEVYALSEKRNADFTNSCSAAVLFENGAFGIVNSHHCVGERVQRFEAHALDISAYIDITALQKYELWVNRKHVELDLNSEELPSGISIDNYHETLHFSKWLRGDEEPVSGLEDVIKSVKLAQAIACGYKGELIDFR